MNSQDLARYIEAKDGITKPWLLVQLSLLKLQERKHEMSEGDYFAELRDLHQRSADLGEWWVGIEDEVFNP